MTLINYLTRVHFADGVLEEALRSEMERARKRRPLIVAEAGCLEGVVAERFFSSFPMRTVAETYVSAPAPATEAAALDIERRYRDAACDCLIAFGDSRAIDLAKAARIAIAYDGEPISGLTADEGGRQHIRADLPNLYAVPGVSGFASAASDYARVRLESGGQALLSSPHLIPTVTICDPTLTLGSDAAASASAASGVISRAIDAYLSPAYNPPADGLALDGLGRIARNIAAALATDDLGARREIMAGSLNSALSLQKGLCVIHAITNALEAVSDARLDPCAVGRLLMPGLIRFYGDAPEGKIESLKQTLGIAPDRDLADGVAELVRDFPLPNRLSDMGLTTENLDAAAVAAERDRALANAPRPIAAGDIRSILEDAR